MPDRRSFLKLTVGTLVAGAVYPWSAVPPTAVSSAVGAPPELPPAADPTFEAVTETVQTFRLEAVDPMTVYPTWRNGELVEVRQSFIAELWTDGHPERVAYSYYDVEELAHALVVTERMRYVAFLMPDLVAVQASHELRSKYLRKIDAAFARAERQALDAAWFEAEIVGYRGPRAQRPLVISPKQFSLLVRRDDFVLNTWPSSPRDPIAHWRGRPVHFDTASHRAGYAHPVEVRESWDSRGTRYTVAAA